MARCSDTLHNDHTVNFQSCSFSLEEHRAFPTSDITGLIGGTMKHRFVCTRNKTNSNTFVSYDNVVFCYVGSVKD